MAVHSGKRGEADDQTGWRLYFVRGEKEEEAHLLQVRRCVQALRSRGSLLLINQSTGTIFLWHGAKSLKHTRQVASSAAAALKLNRPPELNLRVSFYFIQSSCNSCFASYVWKNKTHPSFISFSRDRLKPVWPSRSSTKERSRANSGKVWDTRVAWPIARSTCHWPRGPRRTATITRRVYSI